MVFLHSTKDEIASAGLFLQLWTLIRRELRQCTRVMNVLCSIFSSSNVTGNCLGQGVSCKAMTVKQPGQPNQEGTRKEEKNKGPGALHFC